jgi:hypothetical protein
MPDQKINIITQFIADIRRARAEGKKGGAAAGKSAAQAYQNAFRKATLRDPKTGRFTSAGITQRVNAAVNQSGAMATKEMGRVRSFFTRSSGGYGDYILGGMVGGRAGLTMAALHREKLMGRGAFLGGLGAIGVARGVYAGGRAIYRGGAGLFGLNKEGFQEYSDFQRAVAIATRNLDESFGDNGIMSKSAQIISETAKNLSVRYALGGTATQYAESIRMIAGADITPANMSYTGRMALIGQMAGMGGALATVAEDTTSQQATRAIMTMYKAIQGTGGNRSPLDIAAQFWYAGKISPIEVSDFAAQAAKLTKSTAAYGGTPEEMMATVGILGGLGFTGATAATAAEAARRNIVKKAPKLAGMRAFGGMSAGQISEMSIPQVLSYMLKQRETEGLTEGDLRVAMSQLFNIRASGALGALINDDILKKLSGNIEELTDATKIRGKFLETVAETSFLGANALATAKGALGTIRLGAMEALMPIMARGLSTAGLNIEAGRLQSLINVTEDKDLLDQLRKNLKDTNDQLAIIKDVPFDEFVAEIERNTPAMFRPLVEPVAKLGKMIEELDKEDVQVAFQAMATAFSNVANVLAGFASIIEIAGPGILKTLGRILPDEGVINESLAIKEAFPELGIADILGLQEEQRGALYRGRLTPEEVISGEPTRWGESLKRRVELAHGVYINLTIDAEGESKISDPSSPSPDTTGGTLKMDHR